MTGETSRSARRSAAGEPQDDHPQLVLQFSFPIDASVFANVLKAVSRGYPKAVLGEDGKVWDRPVVTNAND